MLQLARRNKLMYIYIYSGSGEIGKAITANLSSTVAFLLIIISERRASISQDYYLPGDDRIQNALLCLLLIRGRRPQANLNTREPLTIQCLNSEAPLVLLFSHQCALFTIIAAGAIASLFSPTCYLHADGWKYA